MKFRPIVKVQPPTFPLARSVFSNALRSGHGRALEHVNTFGADGLQDLIVEACMTSLTYDPQCEAERAPWLFSLVESANLKSQVIQTIATTLSEPPSADDRDMEQRSALLKELASAGSQEARDLLYLSFTRLSTGEVIADEDIVSLDGSDGLLHVARQLGRWLEDDPDFWVHDNLIAQVDRSTVSGTAQSALERAAVSDPDIARYLAGLRHTRDMPNDNAGRRDVADYSGAQILAHLDSHPDDQCHWLRGWGMHADAVQRDVVFHALLLSEEPERVKRLLRCFGKTGVPRFDRRLLQWIASADDVLQRAAIRAVTSIRHEELRQSALQLLAEGDIANGIRLLVANFEDGDYAMCVKHLERLRFDDADERHHLGMEVLELCQAHTAIDALDCLLYVYEFSPCSTCRANSVRALIEINVAPDWVIRESKFDADPDTRALVLMSLIAAP